ncbi:MAG: RNA methyltransferase [Candidatus Hydrogenedentota bacterium]
MAELEPFYANTPENERAPIVRQPLHVVLDNIRSAYNVGSMFRTADAAGATHVHLCGMSAHPPHKKIEKTALGAQDYVPWTYHERVTDCVDGLKAQGIAVVALEVAESAMPMGEYPWPQPVAVVFGNEVTGISARTLRRCDATVVIPMHGHKNSINVATAFGIVLYHILGRWGTV